MPTPNVQCNTALNHLIVNATFNLSSDAILLIIALPMFIRTQMPVRKKAALCIVFGLGIFVMISAILNKYYSFTNPFGSQWTFWYARESSTSMLVANLPFVYTLFRRVFKLRSLDSTGAYGTRSKTGRTKTTNKGTMRSNMVATLMSRNRDRDDEEKGIMSATAMPGTSEEDIALEGIKKEVGVTFISTPAWMEGYKGNAVTITAGELPSPTEEHVRPEPAARKQSSVDAFDKRLSMENRRSVGN